MINKIESEITIAIQRYSHLDANNRSALFLALLEDRRYWWHCGVDPYAVLRAFFQFVFLGKKSGASTIEMQLVRTISNDRGNSLKRKLKEMRRALWLCSNFSKEQILATYWNICFKGDVSKSNANYLQLHEKEGLLIEYDIYTASAVRYPTPTLTSNTWQHKIVRRTKYAYTLLHRIEKGVRIGPLIIAIDRAGLHIFSARLRSLVNSAAAHPT